MCIKTKHTKHTHTHAHTHQRNIRHPYLNLNHADGETIRPSKRETEREREIKEWSERRERSWPIKG